MDEKELEKLLQTIQQLPSCEVLSSFGAIIQGLFTQQLINLDEQILMLTKLSDPLTLIPTLLAMFTKELSDTELQKLRMIEVSARIVQALDNKARELNCP